ncbi:hypothetical protein VTJ49DRAFT_858 [Mycothermus thermophilus]|uniref:DNA (cytosine-5-)-methyltransferase n=1 Tax=Humicola insolens TaxID=85995 RepID=A0ABR3VP44_HUMIN
MLHHVPRDMSKCLETYRRGDPSDLVDKSQHSEESARGLTQHVPDGIFDPDMDRQRGDASGDMPWESEDVTERGPEVGGVAEEDLAEMAGSIAAPEAGELWDGPSLPPWLDLPTDPAKLKALPAGFHEMTGEEQQEELLIVHVEDRLGTEWQPSDGKPTAYSKAHTRYSPTKIIGMLHRWRNRTWKPRQWRLARAIARNRTLRPAFLAAQAFLRRQVLLARCRGEELKIERYLGSTKEWKSRLANLERQTGITEADIKQWLWILAPESGDTQLQRFLASQCRKPLFVLQILLAKDKKIREPATFVGVVKYVRENYVLDDRPPDKARHPAYKNRARDLTWFHFLALLYRLVWHCREEWPAGMPLLASLTADYIGTMRLDTPYARALMGLQARSTVLNKALGYMAWPARIRPFDHMEHNWAAQRRLLQLAATLEPPLVIDRNGYRSVRSVLIALSKTKGEAKTVERAALTWPPYRRVLDGIDEQRDPEDDLSRSAKAGILKRAAGYSDETVDRALNALGGSIFGDAPTIQTRSLLPAFYSDERASENLYTEWTAKIRATRNAREAWKVFQIPPMPGIRPTAQVYGEMFEKLFAKPVTESPFLRPGDVKESFPVHDGNLSEFEIARITPPSPEELYERMMHRDHVRPVGFCLATLVRNAPSRAAALRYLDDSPLQPLIQALRVPVSEVDAEDMRQLTRIPVRIFNAWIELLCRLHKRPRMEKVKDHRGAAEQPRVGFIPEAIALASRFQAHNARMAHHDKAPWHSIMEALAGPKILYSRRGPEFNNLETLVTFMKLFERTTASKGIDPISFEALEIAAKGPCEEMLFRAHAHAVSAFAALTEPIPTETPQLGGVGHETSDEEWEEEVEERENEYEREEEKEDRWATPGMPRFNVIGRPLYRYMVALAVCGDRREMVRVMDWLLDGWEQEYVRESAKMAYHIDYRYTMRMIEYFAEIGKVWIEPEEVERIRLRLEELRREKGYVIDLPPQPQGTLDASTDASSDVDCPVESKEFKVIPNPTLRVELPRSTLINPRSHFNGYTPPLPLVEEREALAALLEVAKPRDGFTEIDLDLFCFYIDTRLYAVEMRPLHHMTTKSGQNQFYFDGILKVGDTRHYVQGVPVVELPIGNYGPEHDTTREQIWVRSAYNSQREVYYRLNNPSIEYERFYDPFLWVADLTKHVVDYSAAMIEQGRQIDIHSFRSHFKQWLTKRHGKSIGFMRWRRAFPRSDFRTAVSANREFIWKEMTGVLGLQKSSRLLLFREILYYSRYKPVASPSPPLPMIVQGDTQVPPTIVTPYIKECFGHMIIGKMLRTVGNSTVLGTKPTTTAPSRTVSPPYQRIPTSKRTRTSEACFLPLDAIDAIKVGDVISTPPDGDATDTKWRYKRATDDARWFGLVQRVHVGKNESRSFDVSWFYRPVETPCCLMKYPWPNELFLSDHCTCQDGSHARVKEHEVLGVHDIDWFGVPGGGKGEFFVRQLYVTEHRRWITLRKSHLTCSHDRLSLGFKAGDTVLATLSKSQQYADPFEVVKVFKQGEITFVRVRHLLRRSQFESRAAPNELVYTDYLDVIKVDRVLSKCTVRFFLPDETIPTPYNRRGTGNCFFIRYRLEIQEDGAEKCVPFAGSDEFPASLRQGFDPTQPTRKLRGLDLFCGSGNFGRGLEDGGAVEMRWANDIWAEAIHTYMANTADGKSVHHFLGSVDDLLRLAQEGKFSDSVPRPGEVEFIAAGSPCQGFSLLTADKTTLQQIKNQSFVASFASFVDFYRPKYGVLENVTSIIQNEAKSSEDILSQLFCALVGMGYQAHLVFGDAWAHGAPQNRERVFLMFAAPGLRMPDAPAPSHRHHRIAGNRSLGYLCNGEPFVHRSFQPTAFKFVSAAEATADLPPIGDGKAEPGAIAFPDHRLAIGVTPPLRAQIAAIPNRPYGLSFAEVWYRGRGSRLMTPAVRALFPADGKARVAPNSKGWGRVVPTDVFNTVTTQPSPVDARAGTRLHWDENRTLTVLEVRRAQGFPDEDVLLGVPRQQWRLVGNSVARQMAVALGLKFREAWEGTLRDEARAKEVAAGESVSAGLSSSSVVVVEGRKRRSMSRSAEAEAETRPAKAVKVERLDGGRVTPATEEMSLDGVNGLAEDKRRRSMSRSPDAETRLTMAAEILGPDRGDGGQVSPATEMNLNGAQGPTVISLGLDEDEDGQSSPAVEEMDLNGIGGSAATVPASRQDESLEVEQSGPSIVRLDEVEAEPPGPTIVRLDDPGMERSGPTVVRLEPLDGLQSWEVDEWGNIHPGTDLS